MTDDHSGYLLAYFANGNGPDCEQIRFAVTEGHQPTRWRPLNAGAPVLVSDVSERGVRDPFILRDDVNHRFVVVATDLRTWPDEDWARAVRHGSRGVVVWESADLVKWSPPRLITIAPPEAGNAWAPKAFRAPGVDGWVVFFASALYQDGDDRVVEQHQRILCARTRDFRSFEPAAVYLDRGHDVIDLTFLSMGEATYRFSADSMASDAALRSQYISQERGDGLFDPDFAPVVREIGRGQLARGEGPAVFSSPDGRTAYLLIDEFGLRGYQLFRSTQPASGAWEWMPDAALPPGARHGSVIPITAAERRRLVGAG